MSSRLAARITGTELGMRPRNYGHLQGLAARYARTRLDGRAIVNRATHQPILLDWRRGLSDATAPGTAPELLLSLPALLALLATARYLGSGQDLPCCSDVRQTHGFGAMVDVIGRPIDLCLVAREDGRDRLVFDRVLSRAPLIAPREDGGVLPDGPGARSQALQLVLARAHLPPRRQDGGEADGANDETETPPIPSDASSEAPPEQIALGPMPMSGDDTTGMSQNVQPVLGGDKCEEQFHDDEQICRALSDETSEERAIRARCWQSAKTRRDLCKKGYDVPPLVTWRESTPVAPSRGMPSLPPLIFPVPPGEGVVGGFGLRPKQVIPFE
jgi:hypothetical protein